MEEKRELMGERVIASRRSDSTEARMENFQTRAKSSSTKGKKKKREGRQLSI